MLLGLTGVGLFAMACRRYLVQGISGQLLQVHLPGKFDKPAHSFHRIAPFSPEEITPLLLRAITLNDFVQVQSWQLSWTLCFSEQTPQWMPAPLPR